MLELTSEQMMHIQGGNELALSIACWASAGVAAGVVGMATGGIGGLLAFGFLAGVMDC